jgi:hypothetical protein
VGHFGQRPVGVDRVGVADGQEHGDVGFGVGVGVGLAQIDAPFLGQFTHGHGLVLALGEELHLAGELAVLVEGGARRDGPGDAQQFGEGLDDFAGRHAHEPHLVALGQMMVDEFEGLGVDERFDDVVDRLGDEGAYLLAVPALGDLEHRFAYLGQFFVVGAEAHEEYLAKDPPHQRAAVQQAAGVEFGSQRDEGGLGDDGLIEIEEGCSHASMLGLNTVKAL